jgi:translation initiation factor 2 alpha subunit (eIF-2alpha)
MSYTLFCVMIGRTTPFSVEVDETQSVDKLKKAIKKEQAHELGAFDAVALTLYKIKVDGSNKQEYIQKVQAISQDPSKNAEELNPISKLSKCFEKEDLTEPVIRILVQPPQGESTD